MAHFNCSRSCEACRISRQCLGLRQPSSAFPPNVMGLESSHRTMSCYARLQSARRLPHSKSSRHFQARRPSRQRLGLRQPSFIFTRNHSHPFLNPEGIPSLSPALRGTSYAGNTGHADFINSERVESQELVGLATAQSRDAAPSELGWVSNGFPRVARASQPLG